MIKRTINASTGEITDEEMTQEEIDALAAIPMPVPREVSPYQARIALLGAGLLDAVTALMEDVNTPQAAKIAWEYATVWERNSTFIATLGPALSLTEEQIDALFIAAGSV